MTYTSHGLMTAADMAEYRQDHDWDEIHGDPQGGEDCPEGTSCPGTAAGATVVAR